MSEPTITIPARKAVLALEILKYVDEINAPIRISKCCDLHQYLSDEIRKQCNDREIITAMVAAKLESCA